jgi:hypothetical protein
VTSRLSLSGCTTSSIPANFLTCVEVVISGQVGMCSGSVTSQREMFALISPAGNKYCRPYTVIGSWFMWYASFKKSEATPDARPSSSRRLALGTDSNAAVFTTLPYWGDLGSASRSIGETCGEIEPNGCGLQTKIVHSLLSLWIASRGRPVVRIFCSAGTNVSTARVHTTNLRGQFGG